MPLPGGAADKLGNRYELWWTALQVQNLLRGQWDSIRVEVPGEDKVEFELVRDAVSSFHQAKRSAPNGKWTSLNWHPQAPVFFGVSPTI